MTSSIGYKGVVRIKVKNKPVKKLNNSGTPELFKVLYDILAHKLTPYSSELYNKQLPTYIVVLSGDKTLLSPEGFMTNYDYKNYRNNFSMLQRSAPIISRDYTQDEGGKPGLRFTATINNNSISSRFNTRISDNCYLVLLDGKPEDSAKILAFVKLDLNFVTSLASVAADPNGQAVIEWDMYFDNDHVEVK